MKNKIKLPFTVIVDSREQKPYTFGKSKVAGLKTGDYSILGLEDKISIERKSKSDLFSSLSGKNRDRFKKEIIRLVDYDYGALIIESDVPDLLIPLPHTQMNPKAVIGSVITWSIIYNLHVFFASDRKHAKAVVYKLLEKYWEKNERER